MNKKRFIFFITILMTLCMALSSCSGVEKGDVLLKVEGEKVHENMFVFFCNLLLNQDETLASYVYIDEMDENDVKEAGLNFAKEYYFRLNEAYKHGTKLTDEELDELNEQFESDYESYKEVDGKALSKEEFYDYYYGLTESQYKTFWKNWALVEKYTSEIEKEIVVTDDMQKKAYDLYYDYIHTYNLTMLTLDTSKMSESEKQAENELALQIKSAIESGEEFEGYVEKYCDDESLKENKGDIDYFPYFQYNYPNIHKKVTSMIAGDVEIAVDGDIIYVFRLESIDGYEQLLGGDLLKEWAIVYQSNKMIEDLVASDKYSFKVYDDVYKECDISSVITEAMIYWQSIWASEA